MSWPLALGVAMAAHSGFVPFFLADTGGQFASGIMSDRCSHAAKKTATSVSGLPVTSAPTSALSVHSVPLTTRATTAHWRQQSPPPHSTMNSPHILTRTTPPMQQQSLARPTLPRQQQAASWICSFSAWWKHQRQLPCSLNLHRDSQSWLHNKPVQPGSQTGP